MTYCVCKNTFFNAHLGGRTYLLSLTVRLRDTPEEGEAWTITLSGSTPIVRRVVIRGVETGVVFSAGFTGEAAESALTKDYKVFLIGEWDSLPMSMIVEPTLRVGSMQYPSE